MTDLTTIVPPDCRGTLPRLSISPLAEATLRKLVDEYGLDFNSLVKLTVTGLLTELNQPYYHLSPWFRRQPAHLFMPFQLNRGGDPLPPLRLPYRMEDSVILAPGEIDLPEDYFEQRVLEETRVDYFT